MREGDEAVRRLPRARTGPWPAVRGAAVGAVATGLAWAAHVWAGGAPPELSLLLAAATGVAGCSVVLSRYRWTVPRLLALLLVVQVLLHWLFDQAAPAVLVHPAGHPAGHLPAGLTSPDAADGSMTVAHVLAAVTTAWLLARGEDWLWLLLELLALRATRLLRPLNLVPAVDAPAVIPAWSLPSPQVGLGAWSLRGPPVVSR